MKNKEQEIGGFDVLSFQLEMLQTTKCIFLGVFFVFFLLIPGAPLPSYVWDKRCLFSLFHSCSLTKTYAATPSSGAARRENGVTHKSEVSDYFKSSLSTLGPSDTASFPDKYGAGPRFSPGVPRHLTG